MMATRRYLLLIYRDKSAQWRWRFSHRNGKVLADGGEGYATRSSAIRAAKRLRLIAGEAELIRQT